MWCSQGEGNFLVACCDALIPPANRKDEGQQSGFSHSGVRRMKITEQTVQKMEAISAEVMAQTDRGAAIISAAILDELLEEALKRRLILTTTLTQTLFNSENGVLCHLAQKIDIAFAVGIISTELRNDLHTIRRIRNRFAHKIEPLTFENAEISKWCTSLFTKSDLALPRHRFLISCGRISMVLSVVCALEMKLNTLREEPGMEEQIDAVLNRVFPDASPDT
jgi:DNA-binding MltR family transcriptional regulator